jgi:hypothetical protein
MGLQWPVSGGGFRRNAFLVEAVGMDDDGAILEGMDEALHSMIAEGDLRTVYDPGHRDLIFFFPDQEVEIAAERN